MYIASLLLPWLGGNSADRAKWVQVFTFEDVLDLVGYECSASRTLGRTVEVHFVLTLCTCAL